MRKWLWLLVLVIAAAGILYVYFFTPWWPALGAGGEWYGNWGAVAFSVLFFSAFVLAFLRPPHRREWRHLGISEAYLVALFTEMFGLPFTIYLLSSVLGVNVGLSGSEGHLWATLLDRAGLLPLAQGVLISMGVSLALIAAGLWLMAYGWWRVWKARGALVTDGLYAVVRHPQYAGFLLVLVAFLIQWPTLVTLIMLPILVVMYVRLARREELEMAARYGQTFAEYQQRTPMLVPRLRSGTPS